MPQSITSRILTDVLQLTMRGGKAARIYLGAREWQELKDATTPHVPEPNPSIPPGVMIFHGLPIMQVALHDYLAVEGNEILTAAANYLEALRERNDLKDALDLLVIDRDQHEERTVQQAQEIAILTEGMARATLECGAMAMEHDRLLALLDQAREHAAPAMQAAITEQLDRATTVEID